MDPAGGWLDCTPAQHGASATTAAIPHNHGSTTATVWKARYVECKQQPLTSRQPRVGIVKPRSRLEAVYRKPSVTRTLLATSCAEVQLERLGRDPKEILSLNRARCGVILADTGTVDCNWLDRPIDPGVKA